MRNVRQGLRPRRCFRFRIGKLLLKRPAETGTQGYERQGLCQARVNRLLNFGDAPFLLVKLAIGAFAAYTLYRCSHLPLARRGMQLVLGVYVVLMLAHAATGMSALGWTEPLAMIKYVTGAPALLMQLF